MSLTYTLPTKNTPQELVLCRWFAAHSPLIITSIRKDAIIDTTSDSGGFVEVFLTDDLTGIAVDDIIYVRSGAIDTYATVTAVTAADQVTTDIVYSADTSGGYLNDHTLRSGYYVKTIIYKSNDALTSSSAIGTNISRPDTKGNLKIDITRNCKTAVDMIDVFQYSSVNAKDTNLSANLTLEFIEMWNGITEGEIDDLTVEVDGIYIVNAANQIGYKYDSSMVEYFPTALTGGADRAKWLSVSDRIRYYSGYPFDIALIQMHELADMKIRERTYLNGTLAGTTYAAIDETQYSFVNRIMITDFAHVSNSLQLKKVSITGISGANQTTEEIEIESLCIRRNPVYFKWLNVLGGWQYYMFTINQVKGLRSTQIGEFGKYIETLSLAQSDTELLGRDVIPEMSVGAEQLDSYDMLLMESLISSTKVQMLTNPGTWQSEGVKWQTVKLESASYPTRITKQTFNKIDLKFTLPQIQTQTQ